MQSPLTGRDTELADLRSAVDRAAARHGSLLFVAGDAGFGKTRLVREAAATSGLALLQGAARHDAITPYGPLVAVLRTFLRACPEGLREAGPLEAFLAHVLPELGDAPPAADSATLEEALRSALVAVGRVEPTVVFLDDLHWADDATLTLLPALAGDLDDAALLVVGAYRTDELARGHPLRRMRRDLRRAGRLQELTLEPLDADATAMLASAVLGEPASAQLARLVHDRTQGIPFFVEELCGALIATNRLVDGRGGLELRGADLPIPESVRDAVLVRTSRLSTDARASLDAAAVAGQAVDLDLISELGSEHGVEELLADGLLVESESGHAVFRHALARDALYADVPWTRRRTLHRLVAERLELRRAPPLAIAEHWLAAREFHRACPALAVAAREFCDLHAYRDALIVGRRAIDAWPEGLDEPGRLELVERVGRCAQLAGEIPEAIAAWREVADRRRLAGDRSAAADADRQLAVAYDLQGSAELALTARREAARGYARTGRHGDAATELLAASAQLDSAGSLGAALELVDRALTDARTAGRRDLEARALGIEGTVRAKLGQLEAGLEAAHAGLALALSEDATAAAVDVYQHVANVFENCGDYGAAWDTYQTAYDYCEERGADSSAQVCLVCLAAILFFTGQWDRALELDRSILASPHAGVGPRMGAKQHFGLIHAARGDAKQGRRLLNESGAYAERYERQRMEVWDAMGQAWIDDLAGSVEAAVDRCRFILARFGESESLHYPVPALRWATTYLATHGAEREARACAAALARLAADTVNPEALAGLAHALGETALLDGEPEQAAGHFGQAVALLAKLELPYETAQTKLRAGVALLRASRRDEGVESLTDAYRTARKLGARPLAATTAAELAAFGEQVDRRLGRRAAAQLGGPGLTRRELEIVRLVASGRTNREIARDLFLSTRTVDMHVRNVLRKLDCRSRTEATTRAVALGLLP